VRRLRTLHNHRTSLQTTAGIGSAGIGAVVNGSGRIFATRARTEKNDPAAMNSAKHIRHRWRARRGLPRGMPNRKMRTSHSRRQIRMVARKKVHQERDAVEKTRGLLKAFTAPPMMLKSASPAASVT